MDNVTVEQAKALALIDKYENDIRSYNAQKNRLGFFQGKRKKEIDAAIKDTENKIAGLRILYHLD